MKTVSREWAERLRDAGWVRETYFSWIIREGKKDELSISNPTIRYKYADYVPAPTIGELGEDVSLKDLQLYWRENLLPDHQSGALLYVTIENAASFAKWLYTTLLDPDKLAEVWVKVKGSR